MNKLVIKTFRKNKLEASETIQVKSAQLAADLSQALLQYYHEIWDTDDDFEYHIASYDSKNRLDDHMTSPKFPNTEIPHD